MLGALKARCKVRVWGNNPYLVLSVQFAFRPSRSLFVVGHRFLSFSFSYNPFNASAQYHASRFILGLQTSITTHSTTPPVLQPTAQPVYSTQVTSCGLRLTARDHILLVSGVLQTGVKTLQRDSLPHSKQNVLLKSHTNCPTCQQKM